MVDEYVVEVDDEDVVVGIVVVVVVEVVVEICVLPIVACILLSIGLLFT